MAINHSSRFLKRLKRHNVFPHLVAEDLANGVEHTPVDRMRLEQVAETTIPAEEERQKAAAAAADAEKQTTIVLEQVNQTRNPLTTRASDDAIDKLVFPQEIESNYTLPYILFKIFESETGQVTPTDALSVSINQGGAQIGQIVRGISGNSETSDPLDVGLAAGLLLGVGGGIAAAALATDAGATALNNVASKLLNIPDLTGQTKTLLKSFALRRNTKRLGGYIALLAPDSVATSYDNSYDEMSVTAVLGGIGFAMQAASGISGDLLTQNPMIAEAAATLAGKLTGGDDLSRLGLFATTGYVRNPQLELIYSSPVLRRFNFEFRLIPKNATESAIIKNVITTFKRNAAPLVAKEAAGGRYMVPPNQFTIEFFKGGTATNGTSNDYLFKTKNCVLTSIGVDYAPNGYATFKNGAPVETRLSLSFQEVEIMDRTAIDGGF